MRAARKVDRQMEEIDKYHAEVEKHNRIISKADRARQERAAWIKQIEYDHSAEGMLVNGVKKQAYAIENNVKAVTNLFKRKKALLIRMHML